MVTTVIGGNRCNWSGNCNSEILDNCPRAAFHTCNLCCVYCFYWFAKHYVALYVLGYSLRNCIGYCRNYRILSVSYIPVYPPLGYTAFCSVVLCSSSTLSGDKTQVVFIPKITAFTLLACPSEIS